MFRIRSPKLGIRLLDMKDNLVHHIHNAYKCFQLSEIFITYLNAMSIYGWEYQKRAMANSSWCLASWTRDSCLFISSSVIINVWNHPDRQCYNTDTKHWYTKLPTHAVHLSLEGCKLIQFCTIKYYLLEVEISVCMVIDNVVLVWYRR